MKNIVKESLLSALAALLVLGLLQPFGIDKINSSRWLYVLGEVVIVFICGLLVQAFLSLFAAYRNFEPQTLRQYVRKQLVHYIFFVPMLSASLLCFNFWYCRVPVIYAWRSADGSFSLFEFFQMCLWVFIIGFFVLVWQLYRFRNSQLSQELLDVKAINALLEAHQQQLADEAAAPVRQSVVIRGNAQNAHLEICPDDIIYIESMSNYADIVYIKDGATLHTTLRITLKQLREQLAEAESLVQCHRAFLVNLNFVRNLSVRSAGTYELELFGLDKRIPVSRANADVMKQSLEK